MTTHKPKGNEMKPIDTETLRAVALSYDIAFGEAGNPKPTRRGDQVRAAANEIDMLRSKLAVHEEINAFLFHECVDVGECECADSEDGTWKYYGAYNYMAEFEDDHIAVYGNSIEEVVLNLLGVMESHGHEDLDNKYPTLKEIK